MRKRYQQVPLALNFLDNMEVYQLVTETKEAVALVPSPPNKRLFIVEP